MPAAHKPLDLGRDTAESFNLVQVAGELMNEPAFPKSGRVARTLVRSEHLTAVVTVIDKDAAIHEHVTEMPTILSVISGEIVVTAGKNDTALHVPQGAAAVLAAACPHRVTATQRSVFLIVMGGRS